MDDRTAGLIVGGIFVAICMVSCYDKYFGEPKAEARTPLMHCIRDYTVPREQMACMERYGIPVHDPIKR